jgi:hypothetical protein
VVVVARCDEIDAAIGRSWFWKAAARIRHVDRGGGKFIQPHTCPRSKFNFGQFSVFIPGLGYLISNFEASLLNSLSAVSAQLTTHA